MKHDIKIVNCNTFLKRFKGLMLKKKIEDIYFFPNCSSIHTFFMLKPIDVFMTDKNYNILYIYKNVKPWRVLMPKKGVKNIFECPTNVINKKEKEKFPI